jgi:hypothetical protein
MPIEKSLSDLESRALNTTVKARLINGLVIFDLPEDAESISSEDVKRLDTAKR